MTHTLDATPIRVTASDRLQLAGERFGPVDADPVILLHGGGQSRSAWRGAAKRLASSGMSACIMDLRGHGESEWSADRHYAFDDYAADLAATIDCLGGWCAGVVGASLGGHIGLIAAAKYPEKIGLLMLADVTPWIDETIGDSMREALRQANRGFASVEDASDAVTRLRGTPPSKGSTAGLLRHLRRGADGRFYFLWDPAMMDDDKLRGGGEGGIFQRAAGQLPMPVMVMRAEHSTLTSPAQVQAFRHVHADLAETVIPGVGHMVSGDSNDAYAEAILAFIAARKPARPRVDGAM